MAASLKLKGFKELKKRLQPSKFTSGLRRNISRAMTVNGIVGADSIKQDINSGKFKSNSSATTVLKGSDRPLVDTGELSKSITSKLTAWNTVFIGVLRHKTVRGRDGQAADIVDVANIVHNGAVINVTDKMRKFMAAKGVPLRASTRKIRIPPRRFLKSALKRNLIRKYEKNVGMAVQRALSGR